MDEIIVPDQWSASISDDVVKFRENQSFMVVGRSGSGKTTFLFELLKNASYVFDTTKQIEILYLYKAGQQLFEQMEREIENIHFHKGMMTREEIIDYCNPTSKHLIVVMDDLMREVMESPDVMDLFTISCHHSGCSIIVVKHNLFYQGRYSKTLAVNAGYAILSETPAGMEQVQTYGRQRFPEDNKLLMDAYNLAVSDIPYGYIVVDMTANVFRKFRIRSGILPEEVMTFYIRSDS